MKRSVTQRLDQFSRQLVPFGVTVALVVIGLIPLRVVSIGDIAPSLPIISVFYWTLYRPDLLPVAAVFAIGLLHDALAGTPFGLHAAVFVAAHGFIQTQRRFLHGKPFLLVWLAFVLVALLAELVGWLLMAAYHGRMIDPMSTVSRVVVTIICYPLLSAFLSRCLAALPKQD